jgi:hypothetical protein
LLSITINTKTTVTTLAILSMVALMTAVVASSIVTAAYAAQVEGKQGGPKAQTNHGDCQKDFNEKQCKRLFTGSS